MTREEIVKNCARIRAKLLEAIDKENATDALGALISVATHTAIYIGMECEDLVEAVGEMYKTNAARKQ
jgi:hypothetical protein